VLGLVDNCTEHDIFDEMKGSVYHQSLRLIEVNGYSLCNAMIEIAPNLESFVTHPHDDYSGEDDGPVSRLNRLEFVEFFRRHKKLKKGSFIKSSVLDGNLI